MSQRTPNEIKRFWITLLGVRRRCPCFFHKGEDREFHCSGDCPKVHFHKTRYPFKIIEGNSECFCLKCVKEANWSEKIKKERYTFCFRVNEDV